MVWLVFAVAGCAAGDRARSFSGVPADRLSLLRIAYEVRGDAAQPLARAFSERPESAAILPAGFEADSANEDRQPASPRGTPVPWIRLEVRQDGQRALARLSFYERRPTNEEPITATPRQPAAAARRGKASESPTPAPPEILPIAVYEVGLPAAELTLILDDLDSTGAFGTQERPDGGAWLSLGPPGLIPAKEWTPEPRLDDLAERVLREGHRVPAPLPGGMGRARVRVTGSR